MNGSERGVIVYKCKRCGEYVRSSNMNFLIVNDKFYSRDGNLINPPPRFHKCNNNKHFSIKYGVAEFVGITLNSPFDDDENKQK